jgi:hypothetical protein
MYLTNKYTRWYYNIIKRAQTRIITGYTKKHHIIPRSLGGDNADSNLVKLTAKEHFVCHLLLTKMTEGKAKRSMCYASWQMTNVNGRTTRERYTPTAKMYELIKKQLSDSYKGVPKTYKIWLGKTHTLESRQLQSKVKRGKNNPMFGRIQSEETKKAIKLAQIGIPKPRFICPHCNKSIGGKSNYNRYHGEKCSINTI